jgi:hypothetical protein
MTITLPTEAEPQLAPTPKAIDALVLEYQVAQKKFLASAAIAKVDSDAMDEVKGRLTAMVQQFGFRHTEKSKRLVGLHSKATTTTGTTTTIDPAAVENFRSYLDQQEIPELSSRFFVAHTTYSLVEGPSEVLQTLTLGKRIREKISSLLGLCFNVKTKAPSLKIETVTPEKP